jgi:ribose/xylose/arabinose/galactoside ABC-type transport system permease subunit
MSERSGVDAVGDQAGAVPAEPAAAPGPARSGTLSRLAVEYGMVLVLVILLAVATLIYSGFLQPSNLLLVLSQSAPLGIVAVGMTFVIIAGGFDLSVGAVYATAGTIFAKVSVGHSIALGFAAALGLGLLLGTVNGVLVTRFKINPFVATLGTTSVYSGGILLYSHSKPFTVTKPEFMTLGAGGVAGIPYSVIALVAAFAVGAVLLHKTTYGRRIFSVGGNAEASRLSGIPVRMIRASTYTLSGVLAALGGVMAASRLGVGQGDVGASIALDAIAVVVIGGTSLAGGEGRIWRSAIGLLILAILNNIFFSLAVDSNWQLITKGAIVVAAVATDQAFRDRWSTA